MNRNFSGYRTTRFILAIAMVIAVAGCATIPRESYNKIANGDVHRVCVLAPPATREYAIQNIGHVGYSFGLVGALIAAGDIRSKTNDFTEAAQSAGFDLAREYQAAVMTAMQKAGYETKLLAMERSKLAYLDSYNDLDDKCDIYLDSTVFGGYLSASATTDYIPVVRVAMRAVKRTTKEVVYQELVSYGYEFRGAQAISIAADPKYRFRDHAALMANVPLAVDGIRNGVPLVVAQISRDLSP